MSKFNFISLGGNTSGGSIFGFGSQQNQQNQQNQQHQQSFNNGECVDIISTTFIAFS